VCGEGKSIEWQRTKDGNDLKDFNDTDGRTERQEDKGRREEDADPTQ
jgi:hypothetical protein